MESKGATFEQRFPAICRKVADEQRKVFPSVVALSATCESVSGLWSLQYLLSTITQLLELRLKTGSRISADVLLAFLHFITRNRLQHIEVLDLDLDFAGFNLGQRLNISSSVVELLPTLPNIHSVAFPVDILTYCRGAVFNAISTLPALRRLSMYSGGIPPLSWLGGQAERGVNTSCRTLTEVSLIASPTHCADILETLSAPISTLRLQWADLRHIDEMNAVFRRISNACVQDPCCPLSPLGLMLSPSVFSVDSIFLQGGTPNTVRSSTLTYLEIMISQGSSENVDLRCLGSLRELRTCIITHPNPLYYDEETITDLLSCWPRITSLSLNPRPRDGLGIGHLPSIRVLEAIARCGQELNDFHALLHGFENLSLCQKSSLSWECLRYLDLGYSVGSTRHDDLLDTAQYILSLFPRVEIVHEDCGEWPVSLSVFSKAIGEPQS